MKDCQKEERDKRDKILQDCFNKLKEINPKVPMILSYCSLEDMLEKKRVHHSMQITPGTQIGDVAFMHLVLGNVICRNSQI